MANLVIKPDIEFLQEVSNIGILKQDDKSVTIRISPFREPQPTSLGAGFEALCKRLEFLYCCDPYMIRGSEPIDLKIDRETHKVASIQIVETTKTTETYFVKAINTDRKAIERSLDSTPIKVPEEWKVTRHEDVAK